MTKLTYADAINFAIGLMDKDADVEYIDKLNALKGQLAKRGGSGKKGLTKVQKENVERKARIYEILADAEDGMTATEVGNAIDEKCQRATALLHQMMDEGKVEQRKVGRGVRFYAVVADADGDVEVVDGE